MDAVEAASKLQSIRETFEKSTRGANSLWKYLYLWGLVDLVAAALSQVFVWQGRFELIPATWLILLGLSAVVTLLLRRREVRRLRVTTAVDRAIVSAWFALLPAVFILFGLAAIDPGLQGAEFFFPLGFAFFATGAFTGWLESYVSAGLWWLAGVWAFASPFDVFLITAVALLVGYLIPAYALQRRLTRESSDPIDHDDARRTPFKELQSLRAAIGESDARAGRVPLLVTALGIAGMLIALGNQPLAQNGRAGEGTLLWVVFSGVGITLVGLLGNSVVGYGPWASGRSFAAGAVSNAWLGASLANFVMCLCASYLGVPLRTFVPVCTVGMTMFITARLLERWPFYAAAAVLWLACIRMGLRPEEQFVTAAAAFLATALLSGFVLRGDAAEYA